MSSYIPSHEVRNIAVGMQELEGRPLAKAFLRGVDYFFIVPK